MSKPPHVRDPGHSSLTKPCKGAAVEYPNFPENDLFVLDPGLMIWKSLKDEVSGTLPIARNDMGIASWQGLLYVFGGWGRDRGE